MTCQNCVGKVTKLLTEFPGIASALVKLPDHAEIQWNLPPDELKKQELVKKLSDAGYSTIFSTASSSDAIKSNTITQFKLPVLNSGQIELQTIDTPKLPGLNILQDQPSQPKQPALPKELITGQLSSEKESWDLAISGMHCASCVLRVENALKSTPGVVSAVVNLATERAKVVVDPDLTRLDLLRQNVKNAGYDMVKQESGLTLAEEADALRRERHERIRNWRNRLFIGLLLGLPTIWLTHGSGHSHSVSLSTKLFLILLSFSTTLLVGFPFFQNAVRLLKKRSTNMDTLVAIGSLVAFLYGTWMTLVPEHPQPHFLADGIIILMMVTLGKWLETRSRGNAADSLEKLMDLTPKRVRAVRESGREIEIDQADVRVNMLFRVNPGESIATDGEIVEGNASIDESMITGEPMPVNKKNGDSVTGGTRNLDGSLLVRATRIGSETVLENIIQSVKSAQSSKANVQLLADKVASVFVPIVIMIALLTFLGWGLIRNNWSSGTLAAAAVLLISCPCALGLATPMAVAVASSRAARMGLIIKDANMFERSSKLNICMFDKTGTLTYGQPRVKESWFETGLNADEIGNAIAAISARNDHPLSNAVYKHFAHRLPMPVVSDYTYHSGMGIAASAGGHQFIIGSLFFLRSTDCKFSESAENILEKMLGELVSIVAIARDKQCVALISLEDEIRDSARNAIARLHTMNVRCGMISGDQLQVVSDVADKLRLTDKSLLYGETAPHEKQMVISKLHAEGNKVAMVGDGINDASALAWADVSIALASGTDVAKSAADIVIVKPDLNLVPAAIALSRATLKTIHQNLFWAFAYNIIAIPLAALGLFAENGPLIASVAMGASSITVVIRSAMLAKTRL
jgi:heavy metal translocating P-type ATPase